MVDRSEWRAGWRDSVWNRQPAAVVGIGRSQLALPGRRSAAAGSGRERRERDPKEVGSALGYMAAPWKAPVRHRYETGNRRLMRALEWVTAKTWPLAVMDDMCMWLEDGSASSRMFVGFAAAFVMAALLTLHFAQLSGLQAMTLLPVFGGHGVLALVIASFVVGATLLPVVLGYALGLLLRFYVLVNLCSLAAMVAYGSWLLYSYAKF